MRVSKDNYMRGLEAPKSIGLDRDLIAVASSALDHSAAASVLPLSLRTGLLDLGATIGRSIMLSAPTKSFATDRISRVVRNGSALPLLFPWQDIGYKYWPDGRDSKKNEVLYVPDASVGCRLPHIWLKSVDQMDNTDSSALSSIDLVNVLHHVLLVGVDSEYKFDARLYKIPKDTIVVSSNEYSVCDEKDLETWQTLWNNEDGALLIRPDGHIDELIRNDF